MYQKMRNLNITWRSCSITSNILVAPIVMATSWITRRMLLKAGIRGVVAMACVIWFFSVSSTIQIFVVAVISTSNWRWRFIEGIRAIPLLRNRFHESKRSFCRQFTFFYFTIFFISQFCLLFRRVLQVAAENHSPQFFKVGQVIHFDCSVADKKPRGIHDERTSGSENTPTSALKALAIFPTPPPFSSSLFVRLHSEFGTSPTVPLLLQPRLMIGVVNGFPLLVLLTRFVQLLENFRR